MSSLEAARCGADELSIVTTNSGGKAPESPEDLFVRLKERALVALTYIEHSQDTDLARGKDGMTMVLGAYPKAEIDEGAMLVLTVLLTYEAAMAQMPLAQRVARVREIIASGFKLD